MMNKPIKIIIQGNSREPVEIVVLQTGNICCPVCAYELQTEGLNVVQYLFGGTEICPSCRTTLGPTDIDEIPPTLDNSASNRWARLRLSWLNKNDWDEKLVKRVCDRLGIEPEFPLNRE